MKNILSRTIAICTIVTLGIAKIPIAYSQVQPANSWIEYEQSYVKIGVVQKGVHKIQFSALPGNFATGLKDNIQLWRRGKQVAILNIDNEGILFYGVPNDGSSDSILYRPHSARINPYWSFFSDESSYFLTIGKSAGLRSVQITKPVDTGLQSTLYHRASSVTVLKDEYSLSTLTYLSPSLINSFFEIGASRTGKIIVQGKPINIAFQLTNRVSTDLSRPSIKLMVHGRSPGIRNVEVYVGKSAASLRLVKSISSQGFSGVDYSFNLDEGDFDTVTNSGVLSVKSVSSDVNDAFSIAYYSISYPQNFDLEGKSLAELQLEGTNDQYSKISLTNADSKVRVLDITDPDRASIVIGSLNALMVPRIAGKELKLFVSSEVVTVPTAKVTNLPPFAKYPTSPNFIIVTSENLLTGANEYASYRSSVHGGEHKTLVANIKDIYNQFNYGEPSPVAIRRFMEHILAAGTEGKYLFLIGKSITLNERMVRELPDEVPSIGYPGSDILLVEGLAGAPRDVPAVPVGRLTAVSNKNISDYLQKVKEYENSLSGDYSWRKKVLHLNGGKSVSEITQLKNILSALTPTVENGLVGGEVKAFVKQQAIAEVEKVVIAPEVNNGVGLITYFGHGSLTVTDLDMGYVTDASRGYNTNKMYPVMYFTGCGVGNVFSGRYNTNLSAGDKYALSLDWLLTPNKGAVSIIANSYNSFVTPASRYLKELYNNIFTDPNTSNLPIGDIQSAVARKIISEDANVFNVSNVHQSVLQGDPALKVISMPLPDYAIDRDAGIKIVSESPDKTIGQSTTLSVKIYLQNFGRYNKSESIPIELSVSYGGASEISTHNVTGFAQRDTLSISLPNERKISKIQVRIDPKKTKVELSDNNNSAELFVDWEVAKNETIYPEGIVEDLIAPAIDVWFNNRMIRNGEGVGVNPNIQIVLTDDRFLTVDTTNVSVFLRSCPDNSCDFKRINYSDGTLKITSTTDKSAVLNCNSEILATPGSYELLVTGSDHVGNTSANPYTISFQIVSEVTNPLKVIVSPNPATTYVRFETEATELQTYDYIEMLVYNKNSVLIDSKRINSPGPGIKEWYWTPHFLPGGIYYYKVNFFKGDNLENHITGKIALIR
ncbi:putative type IX secretion system sortase PorU2 [Dyadobacter bucti]|uniref:putative type IX secretion system sortase PorU2 n=1 Tax=Dyadobacter bucti TaxID=2572203 RepID=UPI0011089B19|nr:C25 family cysteine peptidase [Dyadobacter bucti]